jgi:hypothetical protein
MPQTGESCKSPGHGDFPAIPANMSNILYLTGCTDRTDGTDTSFVKPDMCARFSPPMLDNIHFNHPKPVPGWP